MIFAGECLAKCHRLATKNFQAAWVELGKCRNSMNEVQRGASLCSRFGPSQGAVWKIEDSEPHSPRRLRSSILPVQTARNHQMKYEKQSVVEAKDDSLADPAQPPNDLSCRIRNRWIDSTQQEWVHQSHMF